MKAYKVVDLFCGCGGLSLGFQMAGHEVIFGLDNNKDALKTFQANFPKSSISHNDILKMTPDDIPDCDILVGGPPCVNFSTSKGSRANVLEGLKLVQAFLRMVYYKKPKYWVMENVPRVGLHLPEKIPLKWIGIDKEGFLPTPTKNELSASSFGAPQKRTRLLIGNYPTPKPTTSTVSTLGDVIRSLNRSPKIIDINYGLSVKTSELSDHQKIFMSDVESHRIQEAKSNHPYMGYMPFPDDLDKPARTVVALQMGRETLVIEEDKKYRRATVRECATIQTFPIQFHFYGNSIGARYKQAGNAVPPILSYQIAKSISKLDHITIPEKPFVFIAPPPEAAALPKEKLFISDNSKDRIVQFPNKLVRGFRVEIVTRLKLKSFVQVIEGEGKESKTVYNSSDIIHYVKDLISINNLSDYSFAFDKYIHSLKTPSCKDIHKQIHADPIKGSRTISKCRDFFLLKTSEIPDNALLSHLETAPFKKRSIRIKSLLSIYFAHHLCRSMNSI